MSDKDWLGNYATAIITELPKDPSASGRFIKVRKAAIAYARQVGEQENLTQLFGDPAAVAAEDLEQFYDQDRRLVQRLDNYETADLVRYVTMLGGIPAVVHGTPELLASWPLFSLALFAVFRTLQGFSWGDPRRIVRYAGLAVGSAVLLLALLRVLTFPGSFHLHRFFGVVLVVAVSLGMGAMFRRSTPVLEQLHQLPARAWLQRLNGLGRVRYGLNANHRKQIQQLASDAIDAADADAHEPPSAYLGIPDVFLHTIVVSTPVFARQAAAARKRRAVLALVFAACVLAFWGWNAQLLVGVLLAGLIVVLALVTIARDTQWLRLGATTTTTAAPPQ